jgi:acetoin:2,6-dichlorophenolindophenol oxidoreductase subunit alpha
VDGNDVEAVRDVIAAARRRAAGGEGPSLIEALTYRQGGHSRADPATYRPAEEVAHWLARDPIDGLIAAAGMPADDAESLRQAVRDEVRAALSVALHSPPPPPEALTANVWEGSVK